MKLRKNKLPLTEFTHFDSVFDGGSSDYNKILDINKILRGSYLRNPSKWDYANSTDAETRKFSYFYSVCT